jgi:hypothetical protein
VDDFRQWNYSSYGIILAESPTPLKRELLLDPFGGKEEYRNLHADWGNNARDNWFTGEDD